MYYLWSGVRLLARLWVGIHLIPTCSSFFPFIASLSLFLSFEKYVSAAQRGTPPWTPFFFTPSFFALLCFASLLFTFLFFAFFSFREISILFCFFDRAYLPSRAVNVHIQNYQPGIRWMQLLNYWAKNVFFCILYKYPSCPHLSQTC